MSNSTPFVANYRRTEKGYRDYAALVKYYSPGPVPKGISAWVLFCLPSVLGCLLAHAGMKFLMVQSWTANDVTLASILVDLGILQLCKIGMSCRYGCAWLDPHGYCLQVRPLTMTSAGLACASEHFTSIMAWSGISKTFHSRDNLFFYFDNLQAYDIPKQALLHEQAADAFLQQADAWWWAARPDPAALSAQPEGTSP